MASIQIYGGQRVRVHLQHAVKAVSERRLSSLDPDRAKFSLGSGPLPRPAGGGIGALTMYLPISALTKLAVANSPANRASNSTPPLLQCTLHASSPRPDRLWSTWLRLLARCGNPTCSLGMMHSQGSNAPGIERPTTSLCALSQGDWVKIHHRIILLGSNNLPIRVASEAAGFNRS